MQCYGTVTTWKFFYDMMLFIIKIYKKLYELKFRRRRNLLLCAYRIYYTYRTDVPSIYA